MKSTFIGIDFSQDDFSAFDSNGKRLSLEEVRKKAPTGKNTAISVGLEMLFAETITLPSQIKGSVNKYLSGLIDVKLPVSIDECQVVSMKVAKDRYMALAVRFSDLDRILERFTSLALFRPQRIIPEPFLLWIEAYKLSKGDKNGDAVLLLNAGTDAWTAIIGEADSADAAQGLRALTTTPKGDIAGAIRNIKILVNKSGLSPKRLLLTGKSADATLKEALQDGLSSLEVNIVHNPGDFVAKALAKARDGIYDEINFAYGKYEHEALADKRQRSLVISSMSLIAASVLLLCCSIYHKSITSLRLKEADEKFVKCATLLLGRTINARGPHAVTMAENEFLGSIDPIVDAFGKESSLSALKTIFQFSIVRSIKIDSFTYTDGIISVKCLAEATADINALCNELERIGFAFSLSVDGENAKCHILKITTGE